MLLALVFTYLASYQGVFGARRQSFSLEPYVGKDLTRLAPQDEARFSAWAHETFRGNPMAEMTWPDRMILAWKCGRIRYVTCQSPVPVDNIFQDSKFVYVFDRASKLVGSMWLETGNVCRSVSVVNDPELGAILCIRFAPKMNLNALPGAQGIPHDRLAELGCVKGCPVLLRVLFPDGSLDRPGAESESPLEVKHALRSRSTAENLAALAWLASPHSEPTMQLQTGQDDTNEMAKEDAKVFANLRSDPEVDQEIEALASSPSPAVRQAAKSYKWWFDFASKRYR